jgi:hypothetical protein
MGQIKKGRKGKKDEGTKEVIPVELKRPFTLFISVNNLSVLAVYNNRTSRSLRRRSKFV